jgi:hypothetical protein
MYNQIVFVLVLGGSIVLEDREFMGVDGGEGGVTELK